MYKSLIFICLALIVGIVSSQPQPTPLTLQSFSFDASTYSIFDTYQINFTQPNAQVAHQRFLLSITNTSLGDWVPATYPSIAIDVSTGITHTHFQSSVTEHVVLSYQESTKQSSFYTFVPEQPMGEVIACIAINKQVYLIDNGYSNSKFLLYNMVDGQPQLIWTSPYGSLNTFTFSVVGDYIVFVCQGNGGATNYSYIYTYDTTTQSLVSTYRVNQIDNSYGSFIAY
ncbi:hypothetical protein DFA_10569 [Cavenderia fasciculata]|uniref:Uncharacterized protein n=1 Tax=Cavenderia fasciculata TaxID=261658 RepID=F4QAK8_CACFS|nr:uncharacterized protein DFA_10569 [Cavenderia fasciculata]EGG15727.1 hypothetical protein DFA_10569 [Cavenderia fasciculata]|eukprot:XP_004354469.1 hypothetical protein DFA_10569 [Cavenderia fasciculata]